MLDLHTVFKNCVFKNNCLKLSVKKTIIDEGHKVYLYLSYIVYLIAVTFKYEHHS